MTTAVPIESPPESGTATEVGERTTGQRSSLALAGFLVSAGIMHFVVPGFFRSVVPRWIGHEKGVVAWSGVAEILVGTLVALPRTRRVGAWLALITFAVVYPANIQAALDAGRPQDALSWAAWLRLPLQFPMFTWAYRRATR